MDTRQTFGDLSALETIGAQPVTIPQVQTIALPQQAQPLLDNLASVVIQPQPTELQFHTPTFETYALEGLTKKDGA